MTSQKDKASPEPSREAFEIPEKDKALLKEFCLRAHREAAAGGDGPFMPVKALGYTASKKLAEEAYKAGWQARLSTEAVKK